ncbi:MAG: hypothetical protein L0241_32535 [Planctomycetia bacterium]|nr:hypothetical protein [Planctomycetia bacterium]
MRTSVAGVVLVGCWLAGVGAARADEKPAVTPAKGYELRVVAIGDTYHGIRFKPTTGESWSMLNGQWEKLEEAAAPPAGDYDITIIPAEALLAVRVDRVTGTTWLLGKGKWNPVKEPAAKPNAKPPGPGFALRHTIVGDQLHAVRFHTKTGATWHLKGDTFEPLAEFGKVPAGEFDLTLIASKKDWMGFRLDKKTGTTWILQANLWQEVTEPE